MLVSDGAFIKNFVDKFLDNYWPTFEFNWIVAAEVITVLSTTLSSQSW